MRSCPLRLALFHLGLARGALAIVRGQFVDEPPQDRRGIADQRDRRLAEALGLLGIGIDADDREIVVAAPLRELREQPRADREHHVGFAPQVAAER